MTFTLDSTLGDVLADPKAMAVLDQYVPGASTNPLLGMAKGMSLRMIISMPQAAQAGITQEKVEAMLADINKAA